MTETPNPARRPRPAALRAIRTLRVGPALLVAGASIAIGLVLLDPGSPMARLVIPAVGIAAAWLLLRTTGALTRSTPEQFGAELRQPATGTTDIPTLRTIDTTLRMAMASAFGVEFMLRPLLREIADWRLMRDHGIDLRAAPDMARRVAGEPLWRLLYADDPYLEPGAPGVPMADLDEAVDHLERI